jgi:hypothetical protein
MVARKFDGSRACRGPGQPPISRKVEQLIVRMAKENTDWGYDRIVGALANLGYEVCDQTVELADPLSSSMSPPDPSMMLAKHDTIISHRLQSSKRNCYFPNSTTRYSQNGRKSRIANVDISNREQELPQLRARRLRGSRH